jgi:hypothetical protein
MFNRRKWGKLDMGGLEAGVNITGAEFSSAQHVSTQ